MSAHHTHHHETGHTHPHSQASSPLAVACCADHDAGAPKRAQRWWPLAAAGVAAVLAEALGWLGHGGWPAMGLAVLAIALSGIGTYKKGLAAIARGDLNINALMSIAVTGAFALGQWPEAAMVMVLFSVAEHLEERSLDRARHAIERLLQVAPDTVLAQNSDGQWVSQAASSVATGTLLRVRPGERIGLDGEVVAGVSTVNQAPITGESMPVPKQPGDPVYAGTINGMAELDYRVQAAFDHTLLARIVQAVQQAQGSKAPTQRFVDRFARIYTPVVCLLALAVAVLPPLLWQGDWAGWLYKALVLLVIACPCALVISTPVAIVSGLAAAARHGILVKGGAYLEQGRKLAWLALDKTGTLTRGEPQLVDTIVLDPGVDLAQCQRLAAALASRSDHPVSQAIARSRALPSGAAEQKSESLPLPQTVQRFEAVPGGGVRGELAGVPYLLGSESWVGGQVLRDAQAVERLAERTAPLHAQGYTVTALAGPDRVLALFAVADTVKPSSREAIAQLHALNVQTAMVSGDHAAVAQGIAAQVGIDAVHAGLLPEDKLKLVRQYGSSGGVGMVGDGMNDAPALAEADIGFAMGTMGTDTAIETADVALMDDDLRKIPRFIRLSHSTHAILVQNISLALGIKLVFLALTVMGLGTMWMAVFADVGASLLVLANSLRLLRK
ncbi:heavy metal translocating P-type ATPase [Pusillimonas sp. SM2304]|uniref:heavy metal translocating P-type ATPase n=1 Tax=Pusillimonas sp. SM2304 TaxID=3073241 RepID=UPI002875C319|nr:heavy metal translocating P-type ATPase [Pusillimonas sp. SM2304]MDS1141080.1 heavy metal translocating P-type ATPase [Pusillimonas sp. SM2304]